MFAKLTIFLAVAFVGVYGVSISVGGSGECPLKSRIKNSIIILLTFA